MPEPGFQHTLGGIASCNPFDEEPTKLSPYTVEEIATLQSRLDKQLGPEYISSRPGAGGTKAYYLAADKVINLANEVFGFNGWSSSIRNIQIDFVDESRESGRVNLGLSVIMRVTLKDGTYHEDVGYGCVENCKGKAAAFEKAKKAGTTDALKRALRNFGNVLGNCVYDKNYIKEVIRIRTPPQRFNPDNLYRHSSIVATKPGPPNTPRDSRKRSMEDARSPTKKNREESNRDEYGGDEFDDDLNYIFVEGEDSTIDGLLPDEISVEASNSLPNSRNGIGRQVPVDSPLANHRQLPKQYVQNNPQTPTPKANLQFERPPGQQNNQQRPQPPSLPPQPPRLNMQNPQGSEVSNTGQVQNMGPPPHRPQFMQNQPQRAPTPSDSIPTPQPIPNAQQSNSGQQSHLVGFFSARAAESLQHDSIPPEAPVFNPHQPTSIPRSLGVDHSKSSPIPRKLVGNQASTTGLAMSNPIGRPDFNPGVGFNPGTRQIGMPPQPGGQQHNRTPYKPPSTVGGPQGYQAGVAGTKRLSDGAPIVGTGQQALNDASNTQLNTAGQVQGQYQHNGSDAKRMRS